MEMKNEDDIENLYIVRRYSEIVRKDLQYEPLSQGLAAKVDSDAERERKGKYYMEEASTGMFGEVGQDPKFYDNIAISKLEELETKSKELEITWIKFKEKLKLPDDEIMAKNQKPDMNIVRLAIQNAQAQIQKNQDSKFGKVKAFFGTSAQVLDKHNYLFDLLPTGDKYTSVFTGALSAIVKATVTHEKIASEMSDGFDEISDQYHISLFYFELFGFLISVMREWYQASWKRLSRSLGSSFLENTVRSTLETLRQYTKRIEAEDERRHREMVLQKLMTLGAMMQNSLARQARDREESDQNVKALTESMEALHGKVGSYGNMGAPPLPTHITRARSQAQELPTLPVKATPTWSRETILVAIEHLKPFLQTTQDVNKLVDLSHSIAVNTDISTQIYKWVMNTSSEVLWIEGPCGLSYPSQATLTSAFMLGNLRPVAIPVMVDFLQYDPRYSWDPEKEFLKMIYALIYQAACAIPESIEPQLTNLDFSTTRFEKLKEDVAALPEALKILADLLDIGPGLQFCIIDGLQLFDGHHMSVLVRRSLRDFVEVLCKAVQNTKGKKRIIKVLFTTEGLVEELADSAQKRLLNRESYENEEEDEMLTIPYIDKIK